MTEHISIRNLEYSDILPLVRISNQTFLEWARYPESASSAVKKIADTPEWQWGAFSGNRLVGYILSKPKREKRLVNIALLGVDPGFTGRGIGSMLVSELEAKARAEGMEKIELGTPYAKKFYEKNGFTCSKETPALIRGITGQVIELPGDLASEILDFERAEQIVELITDDEARQEFLTWFLNLYRKSNGLSVLVLKEGEPAGVVLGELHESDPEIARVRFHTLLSNGTVKDVVRVFEYQVSKKGVRYVGFSPGHDNEPEFSKLGYERADGPSFLTMYTMEKTISL